MNKKQGVIVLFLLLIAGGILFFMSQKKEIRKTYSQISYKVENLKSMVKSDYTFETVLNQKIEINVADRAFHIKGMEDKIVFLKVFGWDCKFCKKEIPELVNLKRELGDSFEVIAIEAQQHTREESLAAIKKYGVNYHIISGDEQGEFYAYLQEKYGWTGIIPLTIVVAKGGKVLAFELGSKSYSLSELMKASLLRN
jgi:thiol-disulfide isomerase/thioredoxin